MLRQLEISINGGSRSFYYRDIYSDNAVIQQNFINKEYSTENLKRHSDILKQYFHILSRGKVPLIIDCGANIGTSALFFLSIYTDAHVIAIEPESTNFNLLALNMSGLNVSLINKGIASYTGSMTLIDTGDAFACRLIAGDKGNLTEVITINDVLKDFSTDVYIPFLLKIDIEGGEKDLFSGDVRWCDDFYVVCIELHDWLFPGEQTSLPFLQHMSFLNRDFVFKGENLFCIKNKMNQELSVSQ